MSSSYLRAVQPTYRVTTDSGYSTLDCSTAPAATDSSVTLGCYKVAGSIMAQQYPKTNAAPGTAAYKTACNSLGAEVTCLAKNEGTGTCISLSETKRAEVCRNASNYVNIDHGLQTCTGTKGSSTGLAWFDQYATDCCHRSGTNTACNPCANSTVMTPIDCGYSADSQKIPYICAPESPPTDCGANSNPALSKGQWFWNMQATGCETNAAGKGWCECFKPYVEDTSTNLVSCKLVTGLKSQSGGSAQDGPLSYGTGAQWWYKAGACEYDDGSSKPGYLTSWNICGDMTQSCLGSNSFWSSEISTDDMQEYCERVTQKVGASYGTATLCVDGWGKYVGGNADASGTTCTKTATAYYCPGDPKPASFCTSSGECPWLNSNKNCL